MKTDNYRIVGLMIILSGLLTVTFWLTLSFYFTFNNFFIHNEIKLAHRLDKIFIILTRKEVFSNCLRLGFLSFFVSLGWHTCYLVALALEPISKKFIFLLSKSTFFLGCIFGSVFIIFL